MGMKKGVSPIIGVIVLLAAAITIGVVITTWFSSWASTATSPEALTCAVNTKYVIDSAKFNDSGKNYLLIKVTNKGEEQLYDFGLYVDNGTVIAQFNSTHDNLSMSPSVSSADKLKRGESTYITLDMRANTTNNTDEISAYYSTLFESLDEIRVTNGPCDTVYASTTIIKYPSET